MKFLELYDKVSVVEILAEDTWSMAFIKGAINGVPIAIVIGGIGHVLETLYSQSKR